MIRIKDAGRLNSFLSLILIVLFFVCSLALISAQDESSQVDIDDLFFQEQSDDLYQDSATPQEMSKEPSEAISGESSSSSKEQEDQVLETVDLDTLTTAPLKVMGKVSASFGMGVGITEWPRLVQVDGESFFDLIEYYGYYDTTASFSVDARPYPYIRCYMGLNCGIDENNFSFNVLTVDELFIDYTLADTVFFRMGQQSLTWGQGRLLDNPANLVSRVSDGLSVRGTIPAGKGTMNGLIYITDEFTGDDDQPSSINPKAYAYAGQWETSLGSLAISLSGHFKLHDDFDEDDDREDDFAAALSLAYGLGPFDLAADITGRWGADEAAWRPNDWAALGQFFWENDDRSLTAAGEYQYDSSIEDAPHQAALALKLPKLFDSSWRPAVRWKHAFQDGSGEIITGITGNIAPKLNLSIAAPILYGEKESYYRSADPADEGDIQIPEGTAASVLLAFSLSFSF